MTPNHTDPHLPLTHIKYLIRSEGHDVDLEVGTLYHQAQSYSTHAKLKVTD